MNTITHGTDAESVAALAMMLQHPGYTSARLVPRDEPGIRLDLDDWKTPREITLPKAMSLPLRMWTTEETGRRIDQRRSHCCGHDPIPARKRHAPEWLRRLDDVLMALREPTGSEESSDHQP